MTNALQRLLIAASLAGTSLSAQATRAPVRCGSVADFVELHGRDTVAFSRLMLTDSTFDSRTLAVSLGALVRHTGRLGAAGDLTQLLLNVWPNAADSANAPAQIADVMVQGADVSARVVALSRGMQMQRDHLPPGGILYMTGVPLFLELLQRRAPVAIGTSTTVPALWLFTGGHVDTVQVSRPAADSVTIRIQQMEYALTLAPDHSILAAVSLPPLAYAGSGTRLVRRDCH
jgi:hypothetical protein